MSEKRILITGALGQIGTELSEKLSQINGRENVIISDIKPAEAVNSKLKYEELNVLDSSKINSIIEKHQINTVYHLAALLSGTAEKNPMFAWKLNMESLLTFLELAKDGRINQIFWPSSIGVFGKNTPRDHTPQDTVMIPSTVYGISKLSGEYWCNYYHERYGVDVRSVRFPGLISWKAQAGGGTTDYAVEIFHKAITDKNYESFIDKGTYLPMLYMDDAIDGIVKLMDTPSEKLTVRTSYNLGGLSFDPEELADEIRKLIPDFKISYAPDFRQAIADSWPDSIDDWVARKDWGYNPKYNLNLMVRTMLRNLKKV